MIGRTVVYKASLESVQDNDYLVDIKIVRQLVRFELMTVKKTNNGVWRQKKEQKAN